MRTFNGKSSCQGSVCCRSIIFRILSNSSLIENGLVKKSSAPRLRPFMRASSEDKAVNIRMGMERLFALSLRIRHTSQLLRSGSMMSRSTRSGVWT